jgi:hypothetical protein
MLTTLAVALSLAVPYLPQTDALCGGAAAAMVFRYWGDTHADVEQFAPLVDRRAGGIADDVLVKAIADRGWQPRRFVGSAQLLVDEINQGRPVIVLLADRGPVNHYVVVTGVDADGVVVHDPSWGPARRIRFDELMRLWRPTNFWALEILPSERAGPTSGQPGGSSTSSAVPSDTSEPSRSIAPPRVATMCDRLLEEVVERAGSAGADAYALLDAVRVQCPTDAGPLREMAGVRFSAREWQDAEDLAERAVARDPHDSYTWELLASSRFVQDDLPGALRAWNEIGKPRINLVQIEGLAHARFQTISAVMGLQPNSVLTERAFLLARRRLQELPDRSAARLTFRPEPDGFVTVTAAIAERRGPPRSPAAWTAAGLQTVLDREARVSIPGSAGQAELWSASWRWWDGRPRVALGFAVPRTDRIRGVWRLDLAWESQAYTGSGPVGAIAPAFDESRAHGALTVSDWLTPRLRYSMTGGIDSWRGGAVTGRSAVAGGSLERRWFDDRVSLAANAAAWAPQAFYTSGLRAAYQSSRDAEGWVFRADSGTDRASDAAPLALWPGSGDGHSRESLLHAHPLVENGAIDLDERSVFGRTVAYAHAEVQRWIASKWPLRAGVATFADVARAARRAAPGAVAPVALGAGLRLRIPGASGTLRVDAAHGLRDGADALTVGWQF